MSIREHDLCLIGKGARGTKNANNPVIIAKGLSSHVMLARRNVFGHMNMKITETSGSPQEWTSGRHTSSSIPMVINCFCSLCFVIISGHITLRDLKVFMSEGLQRLFSNQRKFVPLNMDWNF
ncbi:hypothetical protein NPIL_359021 [Nephila pilipes]|uniref:Uncharacterized protein n=1 Tax=Nephila pilipes TaxID=299642 RepID=A0A8X6TDM1_NEPPI|nr:hypothetical protein NPIL_359021 [Nephila pilipes]